MAGSCVRTISSPFQPVVPSSRGTCSEFRSRISYPWTTSPMLPLSELLLEGVLEMKICWHSEVPMPSRTWTPRPWPLARDLKLQKTAGGIGAPALVMTLSFLMASMSGMSSSRRERVKLPIVPGMVTKMSGQALRSHGNVSLGKSLRSVLTTWSRKTLLPRARGKIRLEPIAYGPAITTSVAVASPSSQPIRRPYVSAANARSTCLWTQPFGLPVVPDVKYHKHSSSRRMDSNSALGPLLSSGARPEPSNSIREYFRARPSTFWNLLSRCRSSASANTGQGLTCWLRLPKPSPGARSVTKTTLTYVLSSISGSSAGRMA
mmetsp:Transcript_133327/g.371677  ORF Transcript_133327/g.371677 Transcript_133327/m.371677 type:complete len:319 (+) Transcript_133327:509-1465(+)